MQQGYVETGLLDARPARRRVAVVGSGIAGLSCAWLLGQQDDVVLFEAAPRLGGHSNTVVMDALGGVAVDTGFIVYNEPAYPNLTALFAHLGVQTAASDMSFAVSLQSGAFECGLEYGAKDLAGLFAQRRNLVRPRFWRMLRDIARFYAAVPADLSTIDETVTLGAWLDANGPWHGMRRDHLRPMAAAIWSTPPGAAEAYPARAFLAFCANHGLVQLRGRPVWRTVTGGSRRTVEKLRNRFTGEIKMGAKVQAVRRADGRVAVAAAGAVEMFDDVVLACHAPDARALLDQDFALQRDALAPFRVTQNRAYLHLDETLMPKRRAAWSAWNVIETGSSIDAPPCVTYWMNRLQVLPEGTPDVFVTLNPVHRPEPVWHEEVYAHPAYDSATLAGQRAVWAAQGQNGVWFAGAWLGAGFHEDGLQAGLAVAEAIGGVRRPWRVERDNARMPGAPLCRPAVPILA